MKILPKSVTWLLPVHIAILGLNIFALWGRDGEPSVWRLAFTLTMLVLFLSFGVVDAYHRGRRDGLKDLQEVMHLLAQQPPAHTNDIPDW